MFEAEGARGQRGEGSVCPSAMLDHDSKAINRKGGGGGGRRHIRAALVEEGSGNPANKAEAVGASNKRQRQGGDNKGP